MLSTKQSQIVQEKLVALNQFLNEQGALPLIELHGFLTAVISSPGLIKPSEWMEAAGITDIEFTSQKQAQFIIGGIMEFYNSIAKQLKNQTYQPLLTLHQEANTAQEPDAITQGAALWAQGYLLGTRFETDMWFGELPSDEEQEDPLATLLFPILALTLKDEILQEEINDSGMNKTPAEIRETGIQILPELANAIYDYWLTWREANTLQESAPPLSAKTSRNDPCPCGSGKKYKKCCLH